MMNESQAQCKKLVDAAHDGDLAGKVNIRFLNHFKNRLLNGS
ncbi:MAG: hypothetical protein WBI40_03755 [Methylococcaceae bacterium]